jgi:hypothetical protein
MTGFSKRLNRVLDETSTYGIGNVYLPASPSPGQIIKIPGPGTANGNGHNIGAGSSVSVGPGVTATFHWDGYSWGVLYSDCSPIVPNAPKDFGVVQYAGPAETPYGVPQTTDTHTTIGEDPCGNILQKTVTKTYSNRSVANQYYLAAGTANAAHFIGVDYTPSNTSKSHGMGYGATAQAAVDMAATTMSVPTRFDLAFGGIYYPLVGGNDYLVNGLGFTWYVKKYNTCDGGGCGQSYTYGWSVADPTLETLYYLDVHEVWTYAAI